MRDARGKWKKHRMRPSEGGKLARPVDARVDIQGYWKQEFVDVWAAHDGPACGECGYHKCCCPITSIDDVSLKPAEKPSVEVMARYSGFSPSGETLEVNFGPPMQTELDDRSPVRLQSIRSVGAPGLSLEDFHAEVTDWQIHDDPSLRGLSSEEAAVRIASPVFMQRLSGAVPGFSCGYSYEVVTHRVFGRTYPATTSRKYLVRFQDIKISTTEPATGGLPGNDGAFKWEGPVFNEAEAEIFNEQLSAFLKKNTPA